MSRTAKAGRLVAGDFYIYNDVGYGGFMTLVERDPDPFYGILDELREMHDRKQKDYGTDGDPLANVRASEAFGVPAWVGCMIRANDKMKRLQTFAQKGTLANEGVEDSLIDLAVYAVIGLQLFRESSPEVDQ